MQQLTHSIWPHMGSTYITGYWTRRWLQGEGYKHQWHKQILTRGKDGERGVSFLTDMDLKQKVHGLIGQALFFLSLYVLVFSNIIHSIKNKYYFLKDNFWKWVPNSSKDVNGRMWLYQGEKSSSVKLRFLHHRVRKEKSSLRANIAKAKGSGSPLKMTMLIQFVCWFSKKAY